MIHVLRWHIESNLLSKECAQQVRKFFTAQQALSRELLGAKPLGICKTSIYGTNVSSLRNPIATSINGKNNTISDTFGRNDSKEIF